MNNSLNITPIDNDTVAYNLEDSITKNVETDDTNPSNIPIEVSTNSTTPSPSSRLKKKKIPFWTEDPNILVKPAYMTEFFPVDHMSFNQKLNAITRTVIILTFISYIFTQNIRMVSIAAVTLLAIFFLYYSKAQNKKLKCDQKNSVKEGFLNGDGYNKLNEFGKRIRLYDRNGPIVDVPQNYEDTFDTPTPSNPLSNVLLTDYDYNPNKKPAPPAFTKQTNEKILENTKNMVQELNRDQPDIVKKLYNDVNTNLELEQSMRQFYSTSNTSIPNDQGGFAEFCYGGMISAKDGNKLALIQDNPRYNLY